MPSFRTFLRYTLFTLLSLLPTAALAAAPTYDLISPIGGMTTGVDLKTYLQKIIITTIGIAGVLAVVMLVICGIKVMMSGSSSGKSEAKECVWNAIFGLLIAIAAWAILFTINPALLKNDATLGGVPVPAASTASPTSGAIAGVTFEWAPGPSCPKIIGTISSIVPPSKCTIGGIGICCAFTVIPSASRITTPPPPPLPPPAFLPPPPTPGVQLNTTRFNTTKTGPSVLISVVRTGPLDGTITVNFNTSDGTALAGTSYTSVAGTLTFAPGISMQTFSIPIIPTSLVGNKQFTVVLSNPSPGITLGISVGTVTIADNTVVTPPSSDTRAPIVTILNPTSGLVTSNPLISVDFTVTEETALRTITIDVISNITGSSVSTKDICSPSTTTCSPLGLTSTTFVTLPTVIETGNYSIVIEGCDTSGNCSTGSVSVAYVGGCPISNPLCNTDYLALQGCLGKAITGSCARGDLDKDGVIGTSDLDYLVNNALAFDMNKDGIIDPIKLTTNFADTCSFHTTQDVLLPCALRVLGNITLSASDRTTIGNIYRSSRISIRKLDLARLNTNLCAQFGCTLPGFGLGGTNQLSIYGEMIYTTFKVYDFNNDGIVDSGLTSPDMMFFESCIKVPTGPGCTQADINLDGFVTDSDLNLLSNVSWMWESNSITLTNLERVFWNGAAQPEAGILNVCQGAATVLLCERADLNKDGIVNAADIAFLPKVNIFDINGDGIIIYKMPIILTPTTGAVVVTPPTSTRFTPGNIVATTKDLIVRGTPGDASTFLGIIPTGTTGTVLGGPIYADGNWWWKIAYTSSFTGWSVEPFLVRTTTTIDTSITPGSGSTKFYSTDRVISTANLNVRATAGLTGTFIGMIPTDTTRGNIIGGPVFVDGYWWWQVRWDSGISGWSVENFMRDLSPPPAPIITFPVTGSTTPSNTLVEGTLPSREVGGTVKIFLGTTFIGSTVVTTAGTWSLSVTIPAGSYVITATAVDQSLNESPPSSPGVAVSVTP